MAIENKNIFFIIFLLVVISFSWFAYQPNEVVIKGPYFPQMDYFIEELEQISKSENIKISYIPVSDIETYLIETNESDTDLALIPNPQGVVNLGERGIAKPIENSIDKAIIEDRFSSYLLEITTSKKKKYKLWCLV